MQNGVTTKVLTLEQLRKLYTQLAQPRPKYPLMDKRGRVWDGPNIPSAIPPDEFLSVQGGYKVPAEFMRGLFAINAYCTRRERKVWRRYQHQKRKQ